jgi:hypothetical protein
LKKKKYSWHASPGTPVFPPIKLTATIYW